MRFKINWASLIVGSKCTVLALFYFVFEGNFPSTSPRRVYIWRGDLTEGFLRYRFGGAYIWRGLYTEGLIFGILRYFSNFAIQSHIFSTVTRKATLSRPVQRNPCLLLSPRPFGRPDTHASTKVTRHLLYVNYFISFPRGSPAE